MTQPWLHIVGIGEDGIEGLSWTARQLVEKAQIIVGGDRHMKLSQNVTARRVAWPSPFDAMIGEIKSHKGKQIVILVTGDPLWYSVGARILKSIDAAEITFHPQISAFQWAACRMGWSLADVETLTVHGRPCEQILPWLYPGIRMLVLTKDRTTPHAIARLLTERGYGGSEMSALCALGGDAETRFDGMARDWHHQVADFHTLAIHCIAGENAEVLPRTGLPDDAFIHDGMLTKQVVRSATLAKLVPHRGGVLWDVGAGCGSIGIEWMRAAPEARAIAFETNESRLEMVRQNAIKLGVPYLKCVLERAPEAFVGWPAPDAIFLGGGLSNDRLFPACWAALKAGGRLVANGVTLEGSQTIAALYQKFGGQLDRIQVSSVQYIGTLTGFKPAMAVDQWSIHKPFQPCEGVPV